LIETARVVEPANVNVPATLFEKLPPLDVDSEPMNDSTPERARVIVRLHEPAKLNAPANG
jgi:hypothetical protein